MPIQVTFSSSENVLRKPVSFFPCLYLFAVVVGGGEKGGDGGRQVDHWLECTLWNHCIMIFIVI